MNILEKLIFETAKNKHQFAKMVGVTPQKINAQIKSKHSFFPAYEYAKKLDIKELNGVDIKELEKVFEFK